MDSKSLVRKDLLRRKVFEYFSKNPKAKSLIVKANVGNNHTVWKVVRENSSFNIVEVTSRHEQFIIEATNPDDEKTNITGKGDKRAHSYDPNKVGYWSKMSDPKPKSATPSGRDGNTQPPGASPHVADFMRKQLDREKSKGGDPDKLYPAEPATITQQQAWDQTMNLQKWKPTNPGGEFIKTLAKTKDLGTTLNTAYDDLVKMHGGKEDRATNAMNDLIALSGGKISGKADLSSPEVQKQVGAWLKSQFPNITKAVPKLPESRKLSEGSVEFTNMSKMFMDAMSDMGNHAKLSSTLRQLNSQIGRIQDPNEKNQIGSMIGALTGAVDASTAGGGKVRVASSQTTAPMATTSRLSSSRQRPGRVVREDDMDKKKSPDVPDNAGLETNIDQGLPPEAPEGPENSEDLPDAPDKKKTEDEAAVARTLKGQTVSGAEVELENDGGALVLDLVGDEIPVRLEWKNSGKIVYYFKGVPYNIRVGDDGEAFSDL